MFHSWLTEAPIIGLHKPTAMLFAVAFFLRRYHFFFHGAQSHSSSALNEGVNGESARY